MKSLLIFLAFIFSTLAQSAVNNYAILVAGAFRGFGNYARQACVYRAYNILLKKGFKPHQIIVFAADDIAYNLMNPFLGQVFNQNNDRNVYNNVMIDYKGDDATAANFLNVLSGGRYLGPFMKSIPLKSGKQRQVIKPRQADNVFLYFTGNSRNGQLNFPDGSYVNVKEFLATLNDMYLHFGYNSMLIMLDSHGAASMIPGAAYSDIPMKTLIVTSTDEKGTSYGISCKGNSVVMGKVIGEVCLTTEFSDLLFLYLEGYYDKKHSLGSILDFIKQNNEEIDLHAFGDKNILRDAIGNYFTIEGVN